MLPALLVERSEQLRAFVAGSRDAPWLGVDTEFVRDRHYFPRAGLIQIATPEATALVDPVALDDLAPLEGLLFATPALKIFHAARQDLELFMRLFDRVPAPLFDSQTAAALVGFASQVGYTPLVAELLGAETGPAFGRYDWLRRPLTAEACEYAAGDVRHLSALHRQLSPRLAAAGAETVFAEAMERAASPALYRPDPEGIWRRLRSARRLKDPALARFKALAAWRERQAIAEDLPRQWIVHDGVLAVIARRSPRTEAEFAQIRELRPAARRRYAADMLAVLAPAPGAVAASP